MVKVAFLLASRIVLQAASAVVHNISLFGPRGESLTRQGIIKDKQINHDYHHHESETRTHR